MPRSSLFSTCELFLFFWLVFLPANFTHADERVIRSSNARKRAPTFCCSVPSLRIRNVYYQEFTTATKEAKRIFYATDKIFRALAQAGFTIGFSAETQCHTKNMGFTAFPVFVFQPIARPVVNLYFFSGQTFQTTKWQFLNCSQFTYVSFNRVITMDKTMFVPQVLINPLCRKSCL